jgi:hypothetical protein
MTALLSERVRFYFLSGSTEAHRVLSAGDACPQRFADVAFEEASLGIRETDKIMYGWTSRDRLIDCSIGSGSTAVQYERRCA